MSFITVPSLTRRTAHGAPLLPSEYDATLQAIEDALNAINTAVAAGDAAVLGFDVVDGKHIALTGLRAKLGAVPQWSDTNWGLGDWVWHEVSGDKRLFYAKEAVSSPYDDPDTDSLDKWHDAGVSASVFDFLDVDTSNVVGPPWPDLGDDDDVSYVGYEVFFDDIRGKLKTRNHSRSPGKLVFAERGVFGSGSSNPGPTFRLLDDVTFTQNSPPGSPSTIASASNGFWHSPNFPTSDYAYIRIEGASEPSNNGVFKLNSAGCSDGLYLFDSGVSSIVNESPGARVGISFSTQYLGYETIANDSNYGQDTGAAEFGPELVLLAMPILVAGQEYVFDVTATLGCFAPNWFELADFAIQYRPCNWDGTVLDPIYEPDPFDNSSWRTLQTIRATKTGREVERNLHVRESGGVFRFTPLETCYHQLRIRKLDTYSEPDRASVDEGYRGYLGLDSAWNVHDFTVKIFNNPAYLPAPPAI